LVKPLPKAFMQAAPAIYAPTYIPYSSLTIKLAAANSVPSPPVAAPITPLTPI
jgi:hypothetical protein